MTEVVPIAGGRSLNDLGKHGNKISALALGRPLSADWLSKVQALSREHWSLCGSW